MNLIPSTEVPSLPNDLIIGWDEILDRSPDDLQFIDHEFLEKNTGRRRRAEHISSRKLFEDLISYLNIPSKEIELLKMDLGKPYAKKGIDRVHTSFSHSSNWVVCALSDSLDIGIDCEPLDRQVNPKIFERILDQEERKILDELSPLAVWTIKEAVVKCIGIGIRTSLQRYVIQKKNDEYFVLLENERIHISSFVWRNHQLAVAWRE